MSRPTNLAGLTVDDYTALPGEESRLEPQKLVRVVRKPRRTIVADPEPVAVAVVETKTPEPEQQKLVAVRPKKRAEPPPAPEADLGDDERTALDAPDLDDADADDLRSKRSRATIRKYDREWRLYETWCEAKDLTAMPSEPETLAAYLAEKASSPTFYAPGGRGPRGLVVAMSAIAFQHRCDGKPSPHRSAEVRAVLEGVRRAKGMSCVGKARFDRDGLLQFVKHVPGSKRGLRDRAFVLLRATTQMKIADMIALNTADIGIDAAGLSVRLPDREILVERESDEICPVRAMTAWLEASGGSPGALFVAVDRWEHLGGRLSERDASRIVKHRGKKIGLSVADYSARSLHV